MTELGNVKETPNTEGIFPYTEKHRKRGQIAHLLLRGTCSWCSGKRTGVTLRAAPGLGQSLSRKRERGEVGAGVEAKLEEPRER